MRNAPHSLGCSITVVHLRFPACDVVCGYFCWRKCVTGGWVLRLYCFTLLLICSLCFEFGMEMSSLNFLLLPLCLLLAAKHLSNGSLLPLWNFNCSSWDFEIMVTNGMDNGQPTSFTVQLEVFFICKSAGIILPSKHHQISLSTWKLRPQGGSAQALKLHS